MLRSDLLNVKAEAERLINRIDMLIELGDQNAQRRHADRLRATESRDLKPGHWDYAEPGSKWAPMERFDYVSTKWQGMVKRASMDLTRALAELRNPYRN